MLFRLDRDHYREIENHAALIEFPLIQAVIQQKQRGEIYSDNIGRFEKLLIMHKSGFSYYHTPAKDRPDMDLINFIDTSDLLPLHFHLYDPPSFLLDESHRTKNYTYRIRKRIQLKITENTVETEHIPIPFNLKIEEVNADNYTKLDALGFADNKFYESRNDFLQNGLGVCIFDQNSNPLSLCYSACIVDSIAEIDIITKKDCRNLGYGKVIAHEFIKRAFKKGILPNWDCFEENQASLKTAFKIGFSISKEYKFLSLYKKQERHEY